MKTLRNLTAALALSGAAQAQAGARLELDLTQNSTTIDAKAYGTLKGNLSYFARDIETFSPETGDSRFTLGTLNYNWNQGTALGAGMMNGNPTLTAQQSGKLGDTSYLIWTGATLTNPSLNQVLALERTGDQGLTTGLELAATFTPQGYLLSKQRARLGYTNEEGLGLGLAANLTQTQDTTATDLGIYLRITN
jgi:hypothetical protein